MNHNHNSDVLCSIDGGGERGYLVALFMDHLQSLLPKHLSTYFKIMGGTSTGGILSALIRMYKRDLASFYVVHGPAIFDDSGLDTWMRKVAAKVGLVGYVYGKAYMEEQLRREFKAADGDHTYLSDIAETLLLFCVAPDKKEKPRAWVISSEKWKTRGNDYDFPLWQVVMATAAAPTVFPGMIVESVAGNRYLLTDGGTGMNNPAGMVFSEYYELWHAEAEKRYDIATEWPTPPQHPYMLSIGTGSSPSLSSFSGSPALKWIRELIGIQMDVQSETTETNMERSYRTYGLSHKYFRFDPPVTGIDMTDASPKALKIMREAYGDWIFDEQRRISELVEILINKDTLS